MLVPAVGPKSDTLKKKAKHQNDDFGCLTHSLDANLANVCWEDKTEGQTQWLIS